MNIIIAVPTRIDRTVDDHFGHCAQFTLFSVTDEKAVQEAGIVFSPPGCGCKSNIASILKQKGVSTLLAGSMGAGAMSVLQRHGIEVHRGCSGDAGKAVGDFCGGRVERLRHWVQRPPFGGRAPMPVAPVTGWG